MLPFSMLVANVIHSPFPLLQGLSVRRLPRPGRGVKTHLPLRPAVSAHRAAKSHRIRTSPKHTHNPCRIRTFKTQHLNFFRICSFKKTGEGEGIPSPHPKCPCVRARTPATSFRSWIYFTVLWIPGVEYPCAIVASLPRYSVTSFLRFNAQSCSRTDNG